MKMAKKMSKMSKIKEIISLGVDIKRVLTEDINAMDFGSRSICYFLIDKIGKAIAKRKGELKNKILGEVRQKGRHHTDKTRRLTIYGDTNVDATTTITVRYDEDRIAAILSDKGIDLDKVFIERTIRELDKEAWQALIKLGVVTGDEAASAVVEKESYRLSVKPGAGILDGKIRELLG